MKTRNVKSYITQVLRDDEGYPMLVVPLAFETEFEDVDAVSWRLNEDKTITLILFDKVE
jgi:hypothetical protein